MVDKLTYSPAQVGELLGLGKELIYEGLRAGAIPSVRVGRRWLIPKAKLNKLFGVEPEGTAAEREPAGQ